MLTFYLKTAVVSCIVLKLMVTPVLGVHGFSIAQSGATLPDEMHTVKLSRTSIPTSQWSQNMTTLFPQDEVEKRKYYKVVVDLEGFSKGPLSNISKFLSALSETPNIRPFTPLLILENGTNYKFNRIYHGIQTFFHNTPNAVVCYYHTGIQSPCAVEKGLGSLAAVQQIIDQQLPVDNSSPINQLAHAIAELTLSDESSASSSPKFAEIDSDGRSPKIIKEVKTNFPAEMLQKIVQYEEVEQKIMSLKERWDSLEGGEWPPLGIKAPNQIKQIHIGSLEDFLRANHPESALVVEVSGLTRGDDVKSVIDLCWNIPSIRCLRIQDSACMLSSFVGFCDPQSEEEDEEPEEILLLNRDRIRFLDVQTALRGGADLSSLSEYSEHTWNIFTHYFVWIPLEDKRFESLELDAQKTHRLFGVFSEYLELLQSAFMQPADDGDL